jgi:outer membrane protein assembly factor BamA
LSIEGHAGHLSRPTLSAASGPFDKNLGDALLTFPDDPGVAQQATFLHGLVSIAADTRDYAGHPTKGGLYRAALSGYSDRDRGQFSFRRYEVEALQLARIVGEKWIVAVHGWSVLSDIATGNTVPFYMVPSLGGQDTLRGYSDYRFHDRNMVVVNVESRWAVLSRVEAAVFADAGNVGARVSDLNLKKASYGIGLRAHTPKTTIGRLDVGHSQEGWQLFLKLDDPFAFTRLSRRTATAPFVP